MLTGQVPWADVASPMQIICEFSCVLGRPVEAENILETNQLTNHSLTDHSPK